MRRREYKCTGNKSVRANGINKIRYFSVPVHGRLQSRAPLSLARGGPGVYSP